MNSATESVPSERGYNTLAAYGHLLWLSKVNLRGGSIDDVLNSADRVFAKAERVLTNPKSKRREGADLIAQMWAYLIELNHRRYVGLQQYVDRYHRLIESSPLCETPQ